MRLRSLKFTALLVLSAAPTLLFAQAEISSKEEERLAALAREDSEWYAPKNSLTVGFRVLGSGAGVHFGNLGIVNYNTTIAPASFGIGKRTYNDGYVDLDPQGRPGLGAHAHDRFAVPVIGVAKTVFAGATHAASISAGIRSASLSRNWLRALKRRLLTVPTGQPRIFAISP